MTDMELTPPSTAVASQATRIEQARAVAEVAGAIKVAQEVPRDRIAIKREMLDTCGNTELANKAFFRFPRGRKFNEDTKQWEPNMIIGPSVHLARELARCWGNIQYGIDELRRDDVAGESEMLAWAWDVQSNTRVKNAFIVPHKRSSGKSGTEVLTDMRDIYENNTNAASRRMRECIFAVLPPWFIEQAKDKCRETVAHGGGKPLVDRISDLIKAFASLRQPVTQRQLEDKVGAPVGDWTADDLVVLQVIGKSLKNGEVTRDDEFPPQTVKGTDLPDTPPAPAVTHPEKVHPEDVERARWIIEQQELADRLQTPDTPAAPNSSALLAKVEKQLAARGYGELPESDMLNDVAVLAGIHGDVPSRQRLDGTPPPLGALTQLTIQQLDQIAQRLDKVNADPHPDQALDAMLEHLKDEQEQK